MLVRGKFGDRRYHDVSESPDRLGFWSIHGALLEGTGCLAVRPWQWIRVGRREVPGRARWTGSIRPASLRGTLRSVGRERARGRLSLAVE